jgi:hypothetical protein
MLNGYLELGGNEVVNSARAYAYAAEECGGGWLQDPGCTTIADAQGDNPYTFARISEAPWYDPDDPVTSSKFLGLYGISIADTGDSTRTATVTERNGDGGLISGYRHTSREVRVRAWLTGTGQEGLSYGMTWLRNVLEPDACGMHGDSCGLADTGFFVACPPARTSTPSYSNWATQRVNLHPNPSVEAAVTSAQWAPGAGSGDGTVTGARTAGVGRDGGYGWQKKWTTSDTYALQTPTILILGVDGSNAWAATANTTYTASVWVHTSVAEVFNLTALEWTSAGAYVTQHGSADAPAAAGQWVRISITFTTGASTAKVSFTVGTNAYIQHAAGDTWIADQFLLEQATALNAYFDGDFADADLVSYSWAGPTGNSPSIYATRTVSQVVESDSSYYPRVDAYRRYLHSVQCISGPLTQQDAVSTDGVHYGKLVEFTLLAGVPWVYGVPAEISLPPIVPTVVQDIAYNLTPYPSAELAGAAVVVATNYSTNPSAETDASVWALVADGAVMLGANCALARTTELFSVGAASVKNTFTATGAGSAGWFGIQQLVTGLPTTAGIRFSVNVWAAGNVQTGTAVMGSLQVHAYWQNSSGTTLRDDLLGTITGGSGALSGKSIAPPAGTDRVIVRVVQNMTSFAAGAVVRCYADALAVTVP